jgi:hypothetical protein
MSCTRSSINHGSPIGIVYQSFMTVRRQSTRLFILDFLPENRTVKPWIQSFFMWAGHIIPILLRVLFIIYKVLSRIQHITMSIWVEFLLSAYLLCINHPGSRQLATRKVSCPLSTRCLSLTFHILRSTLYSFPFAQSPTGQVQIFPFTKVSMDKFVNLL